MDHVLRRRAHRGAVQPRNRGWPARCTAGERRRVRCERSRHPDAVDESAHRRDRAASRDPRVEVRRARGEPDRRADARGRPSTDQRLASVHGAARHETFWPWQEERTVAGLTIDPDMAWLTGFTLGDGSFGYVPALRQHRLRWFSGTTDVLERVQSIVAKHGIRISIQRDPRGNGLVLSTLTQDFVHALQQACALTRRGPKDAIIRVPEHIGKSPLAVVRAFVAGLLDSDGCVDPDGSPSYT